MVMVMVMVVMVVMVMVMVVMVMMMVMVVVVMMMVMVVTCARRWTHGDSRSLAATSRAPRLDCSCSAVAAPERTAGWESAQTARLGAHVRHSWHSEGRDAAEWHDVLPTGHLEILGQHGSERQLVWRALQRHALL